MSVDQFPKMGGPEVPWWAVEVLLLGLDCKNLQFESKYVFFNTNIACSVRSGTGILLLFNK